MKSLRLLLVCAAFLPGCASQLTSTLAPATAGAAAFDLPAAILVTEDVSSWAKKLRSGLQKNLKKQPVLQAPVEILPGSQLRLRLGVSESFEPGSAQIKAGALLAYSAIARALNSYPGAVTHVLAYSSEDQDLEPPLRLVARRSASLLSELERSGVPPTRLRAENRPLPAGQPERLELILKPVVQGQEAQAWTPPKSDG